MLRTALLVLALASGGGALWADDQGDAGNHLDPDGLAAEGDVGGHLDPNGAADTSDVGGHYDPNG